MIEYLYKTWTSPKLYISSFNKVRKVRDVITYTCEPFTFDDWDNIKVDESDTQLLVMQITDAINYEVLNAITSNCKVPYQTKGN